MGSASTKDGKRVVAPREIVRLGTSTLVGSPRRYLGMKTATSCPNSFNALGKAPITSASPPVLAKGSPSEATNRIFIGIRGTPDGNQSRKIRQGPLVPGANQQEHA